MTGVPCVKELTGDMRARSGRDALISLLPHAMPQPGDLDEDVMARFGRLLDLHQ